MTEKPAHPESTPVPVAETTEELSDVISQLETHKKTVLLAIVGAAAIVSIGVIYRGLSDEKHQAAAQAFSQAAVSRNIEELDQVIAEYPGSVAAGNALLTKAELEITSRKSEDAQVTLLTFVEKYKKHPRHSQGLFAYGNLYQVGGDAEKASEYYDRVLKEYPDSELAPFAIIRQGDILLAAGKTDEARLKYESIMSSYRGTMFFKRIEEKLELLKVEKLPVVPEPKKPEPKKPEPKKEEAKPAPKTVRDLITPPAESKSKKPAKAEKPSKTPEKKAEKGKSDKTAPAAEKKTAPAAPKN